MGKNTMITLGLVYTDNKNLKRGDFYYVFLLAEFKNHVFFLWQTIFLMVFFFHFYDLFTFKILKANKGKKNEQKTFIFGI